MSDMMTQEDAINMSNEQAVQILIPMRTMMCDQNGCPISDAVFALDKAIKVLSADRPSAVDLSSVYSTAYKSGYEKGKADRPQGEWVEKPHKVYLPRDYEPDINDYRDRQYNEESHSIVQYWWHCNQCDFEADRWIKPTFNFCPSCGAKMKWAADE